MLTKYFKSLSPLSKAVPQHISHQHSAQMSKKSEVVELDVLMKNEAQGSAMLDIMYTLQGYLGNVSEDSCIRLDIHMHAPSVSSMNYISVLQAVGYFFKLGDIASLNPPLIVVIMEEWANVIVFPFRRGNDLLTNCVDLEHIPLHTGNTINSELLSFILLFTNPSGSALKPFSFPSYGKTPGRFAMQDCHR